MGTPYSAPLETNFLELNLHLLGVFGGIFTKVSELTNIKQDNNYNNLYTTSGFQIGYTLPLGNFFQISYMKIMRKSTSQKTIVYHLQNLILINTKPKFLEAPVSIGNSGTR